MDEDLKNIDFLKQQFENWEPGFSEQELIEDWNTVKSGIKNTRPAYRYKTYRGILLTATAIIIISLICYFIYRNTFEIKNEKEVRQQTILKEKINTSKDNPVTGIKTQNKAKLNERTSEAGISDNPHVNKNKKENRALTFEPVKKDNNIVNHNLSISNILKDITGIPATEEKINPTQNMFPVTQTSQKFPEIIFGSFTLVQKPSVKIYDTVICISDSLRISSNLPGQLSVILPDNHEISSGNNEISMKFNESGECFVRLKYTESGKESSRRQRIIVIGKPNADFSFNLTNTPDVKFINTSFNGDSYYWIFGDNTTSNLENPVHKYFDTGLYRVTLVAFTHGTCNDTMMKNIPISVTPELIAPNVFSPNNDGINDLYKVTIKGEIFYQLTIFDSDGLEIFSSKDKNEGWDGKYKGKDCMNGVYYYVIRYQFVGQEKIMKQTGTINLFR